MTGMMKRILFALAGLLFVNAAVAQTPALPIGPGGGSGGIALTLPLSVPQGGTGGTSASAATANAIGAAALGANNDITSLGAIPRQTWAPTLNFGGVATGITYSVQRGYYIQISHLIHADFEISLSSVGSATGAATISGLPVTSGLDGGQMTINYYANTVGFTLPNFGVVNISATTVAMYFGGTTGVVAIMNTNFSNSSLIYGTITYLVP